MLRIGISTNGNKRIDDNTLKSIKEAGITAIELSYPDFSDFDFKGAKELTDKYGIEIGSLHLPFAPFDKIDPSSLDKALREDTFKFFCDLIKKGSEIGINKFVVHPSGEPNPDNERAVRLENSAEILSRLADFAADYGAVIAVEDLPRSCIGNCSDEISYILGKNDKLRVCFDTNHLLSENIKDFIEKVGDKIITVHISDYDFINERHWLPGEGDINWQELYENLLKCGYNGVWLYEIGLNAPNTIDRRKLEFKDFYNNAAEIFGGQKPTPIGKRFDNLGMWGPN